jgi:DNA-binding GntR family transcriptional regulator
MGHTLVTRTIKISFQAPSRDDIEFFSLNESAYEVLVIERLRFIDGIPIGIETVHFLKEYEFLKDENLDKSLYSILKDTNRHVIFHL